MKWAILLAGGSGTRFWPLSSPTRPKQLLPLSGDRSTAEEAVDRVRGFIPNERILVVAGAHLASHLGPRLGISPGNLLIEPRAASTGPALIWATYEAFRRDPEASLLSMHADWFVPDPAPFVQAAGRALTAAVTHDHLITVGVVPTRPETGYGYIVPGAALDATVRMVARFTEKPSAEEARRLIATGALWNSGLFAWTAQRLLAEVERHTPELAAGLPALKRGDVPAFFDRVASISIDVGLFERSRAVAVVPGTFAWDDIGTWEALGRVRPHDDHGNVAVGPVTLVDARNCVAWSEGTPIVVSGVDNLVVVAANGRILIIPREKAADLKRVLEHVPAPVREFDQ